MKDEAAPLPKQQQLDNRGGPPEKAASGQALRDCSKTGEWGWTKPGTRHWVNGSWSRPIATGFQGNSVRTEQYQVRSPACLPECKRRSQLQHVVLVLHALSFGFDAFLDC